MATIKDIAKATGFSVTTVSRALNDYSDVSEKTRRKIKKAAEELNYSPNVLARSLVVKKSKTIGLLLSGLTRSGVKDNFAYEVLCGINDCVSENGYDLVLFSTSTSKQKEKTYVQLCRERNVDGVILMGIKTTDPYLDEVLSSNIPCVVVDIPITSDTVGYITSNHKEGARKAVEHLISLKHQKIAMINGHDKAYVSQLRLEGYKEALTQRGFAIHDDWIVDGSFDEETARLQALNVLQKHREITALFCASDIMALGALKAASQLNIKVPEQLSIIGYDDVILASYVTPALTTIRQDKYKMGCEASSLLIGMMNGSEAKVKVLENDLVIRYSTGRNTESNNS